MTHYKDDAKSAYHSKMERMGLHKKAKDTSFNDHAPYDGVEQLDTVVPAGKLPIGKQRFKRGGKVAHMEGAKAQSNLGHKPRSKPTDEKMCWGGAPKKAAGGPMSSPALRKKMVGAMLARKRKAGMNVPNNLPQGVGASMPRPAASALPPLMTRKKGGAVNEHMDVKEDKKLIRSMVKGEALKKYEKEHRAHKDVGGGLRSERTEYEKARRNSVDQGMDLDTDSQHTQDTLRKAVRGYEKTAKETGYSNMNRGGRARKNDGGGLRSESTESAKSGRNWLNASDAEYNALRNRDNAQGYGAKRITNADYSDAQNRARAARDSYFETMDKTAHPFAAMPKELGDQDLARFRDEYDSSYGKKRGGRIHRATGGRAKSKETKVVINIGQPQQPPQEQGMGAMGMNPLAALAGAAPGAGAPPPSPMMPPAGAGPGLGAMGAPQVPGMGPIAPPMPPMARKSGGRVNESMPKYQEHDYGSGSGLGRLEKRKWPVYK